MNWEAVGAVGELAGAAAVVATLFYLATQIRHSNTMARRAEHNTTMHEVSMLRMAIAQDSGLAMLHTKGSEDYDQLNKEERLRFDNLMGQRFWGYEQMWDRCRTGVLEESIWLGARRTAFVYLKEPGVLKWWDLNKVQYPAQFIAEIDENRIEAT